MSDLFNWFCATTREYVSASIPSAPGQELGAGGLPTTEVQTCGPIGQAVNGAAGVSPFSSPLKVHDGTTIERLIAATERICK